MSSDEESVSGAEEVQVKEEKEEVTDLSDRLVSTTW